MKENVFGLPMNVDPKSDLEERAAENPSYYAVMRCADMPTRTIHPVIRARNTIAACMSCNQSCWLDPKSYIRGTIVVCLHCVPKDVDLGAPREIVDEVRKLARGGQ